jgi:hypothetical protein
MIASQKKCDAVTLPDIGVWHTLRMVKPPPISLRFRNAEIDRNARQLLRRLEEDDLARRRVKHQAAKALIAIGEMNSYAAPKVRSMSRSERERERWESEYQKVDEILRRISKRGV